MQSCIKRFVCLLALLLIPAAQPLYAQQTTLKADVVIPSVWLRTEPDLAAKMVGPVFTGDALTVFASARNGKWLRVENSARARAGWVPLEFIKLSGKVDALPVEAPAVARAVGKLAPLPNWVSVPAGARKTYAALVKKGRPGGIFSVAGDCNSEPDAYIRRLANGAFDAAKYPQFAGVIRRFERSFLRRSYAASGSFNANAMFDPTWTDPDICYGEGPLVCEVWRSSASIMFISLGTGDQFDWKNFEGQYTRVLTTTLERGALPVLFTKADRLETEQHGAPPDAINSVIRRIARERELPLIDFAAIASTLPNNGLREEGNADFHLNEQGSDIRIVATLYVLQQLSGP